MNITKMTQTKMTATKVVLPRSLFCGIVVVLLGASVTPSPWLAAVWRKSTQCQWVYKHDCCAWYMYVMLLLFFQLVYLASGLFSSISVIEI